MSASDSFRTARSPDPFYSPQSSQGYRIVTPSIRQTSNISTRSPQVHTVQGIETAPAPTMQRNISRSPAFDYDAEAAQGYAALYGSVHLLKKPPSLGDDMEIFESYREKDQMGFKAPMRRGTSDRLTSTDYSTVTRGASTFSRRDETQKAMRYFLTTIGRIFVCLLGLAIMWIPGILSWTGFSHVTLLGVGLLYWSVWLTIAWAGFWIVIAVSYLTPKMFKYASSVVSRHRSQYIHELRAAHKHLGLVLLTIIIWISYQAIIVRIRPLNNLAEDAIIVMTGSLLFTNFICAVILALEKVLIQRITAKFHERSYAKRIQDLERVVQVLSILYKNTVDVVVRSDARLSELIFDSNRFSGVHNRRLHGDHLEGTTRRRAGYTLQGQPLDPFVRTALSSRTKSRSLARRIFYSFSRTGANYIVAEDIAVLFLTPEDAAIAFGVFDREGNGDVSREELEATCLEFHEENIAIADSMRDMDAALSQLNDIMMSFSYVACAVIFAVVMNNQLSFLIAGVGALVLGLSWLIGGSLQEVLTSIIFVFAKHPFDVGDSVVIKDECFKVKQIKLLSTVFLDTNSTLVQVSNHQLNNLFIYNSRRSSHTSETFVFDVHHSTSFQDVEKIGQKMLEFLKSEKRDFQPSFDVVVKDFPGQSRMILSADIKYKSNIVGLKVTRRNKWICALKNTLAELHIYGPAGDPNAPHTKRSSEVVERNDLEHDDQSQKGAEAM